MPSSSSESTSARVILDPTARALGNGTSAAARPTDTGLRGSISAIAARRETSRALLIAADAAAVSFALGIGVQMVAGAQLRHAALLAIPVVVLLSRLFGLYERLGRGLGRSTLTDLPRLLHMATLTSLLASMLGRQLIFVAWEPATTLVLWVSLLVALPAFRSAARWIPAVLAPERCLVVGDRDRAARVRRTILGLSPGRTQVLGWVTLDQIATAADRDALAAYVASERVDHLVVAPVVLDTTEVLDLVRSLEDLDVQVTLMPRLLELASATLAPDVIGATAGLDVRRLGLSRAERCVKRTMDLVGALVISVALAPVLLSIALAIRATSRGGIVFRQQRVGRDGRTFRMFKFRTMALDAEDRKAELQSRNEADGLFKLVDDPRVTRIGRFLRRTCLDELPQLFNVLRGDMSLVGPRPLIAEEDDTIAGWYRRRLYVRPGMSGVWQVMGSARIPLSEMVELDNLYVLSWSPWLDFKILLRTAAFVLARRGL